MEAPDFFVEDLLELPTGDEIMADAFFNPSAAGISNDSSPATAVDSCNSSSPSGGAADAHFSSDFPCRSFPASQFSGELCVPYDDVAELEWLSNFVEDSFTSEDLHKLHPISGFGPDPNPAQPSIIRPDGPVPGKARSNLARVAPSDWATRLPIGPTVPKPDGAPNKKPARKRGECSDGPRNGEVRRCLHCASEKTPQWRTGPMGPKTLCNACGVRYKSGRLVPEYRPAASPTFVATKHSNSHRKVVELRRQNEHKRHNNHHHHSQQFIGQGSAAGVYVGSVGGGDDYLIHHRMDPDFRQLI